MLAGLFRSNRPAVLLALVVLVPLLFGPAVLGAPWPHGPVMPLQELLQRALGRLAWVRGVVGLLLVLLLSVQLAFLVNRTQLMGRPNYLVALFFPLLVAALDGGPLLDPALAGMPFVLLALRRTWSVGNVGGALAPLFDAGLLIGVAALFYLPYAFLLVVVWASVSLIRAFQWREHVVPFLGCAVAFFLAWSVMTLLGIAGWRPLLTIAGATGAGSDVSEPQRIFVQLLLAGVVAAGLLAFAGSYARGVMREKNLRVSFLGLSAALGVIVALQWWLDGAFPAVLAAVPLALFCAFAVQGDRRAWPGEAVVLALVVLGVWAQWG